MINILSNKHYYSTENEEGRGVKVKFEIYDIDTGNYHDIIVIIKDSEVAEIWAEWKPITNRESKEIKIEDNWDIKQRFVAELRKNKDKILEEVYYTESEKYSFLIDCRNGRVYHFNNHIYNKEVNEKRIFLQNIDSSERMCVYSSGVFCPEKNKWLIKSSQALSKGRCSGIKIYSDFYGEIDIKDHQIIAAMFLGHEAIELTMGENAEFVINHRNLDNSDNRIENLEIIRKFKNKDHYEVLRKFQKNKLEKKLKELGVTNYEIKGKKFCR